MTTFDVKKIELKLTVSGAAAAQTSAAFGLTDQAAKKRQIWFCDVPMGPAHPLPMSARGLIVRVRLGRSSGTTTLKLRGPESCLSPTTWQARSAAWNGMAKLEGDWSGDRHLVSASLDNDFTAADGADPPRHPADIQALMSIDQRDLANSWIMPLDRLQPLGPIAAASWTADLGLPDEVTFERWTVADLQFLELSIRVGAAEAAELQPQLASLMADRGIAVDPRSATKTETVLRTLRPLEHRHRTGQQVIGSRRRCCGTGRGTAG